MNQEFFFVVAIILSIFVATVLQFVHYAVEISVNHWTVISDKTPSESVMLSRRPGVSQSESVMIPARRPLSEL